jgi:DNA invertase Pin-like site-specific DNA recombinase
MCPDSFVIPAAQYVRMSTDLQPFSIDNQKDAIQRYAEEHGFEIIATYADPGKSGVGIAHRPGLKTLLRDVLSGAACFRAILVYDVSRWGRFQDVDESAHYEFLCKQAGIPVRYCAEQFSNEDTMSSAVMKVLKRSMAAEFSRELGVKTYAGQKRLALMGYRMSGQAGFGLRRLVISKDGRRKCYLKDGEHKGSATDRTILVPGRKEEVECLRRIFVLAARGMTPSKIVEKLNQQKVKGPMGRVWIKSNLYEILHNHKYIGWNVWGKTRRRLSTGEKRIPKESWIVKANAFVPVISQKLFDRVQDHLARRRTDRLSDEDLLLRLKAVLSRYGKLTSRLIAIR